MKVSYANTAGQSFSLRDEVDTTLVKAQIGLLKGVRTVNADAARRAEERRRRPRRRRGPVPRRRREHRLARGQRGEIWDRLPSQLHCAQVSAISNSGTCVTDVTNDRAGPERWTVALANQTTLTYTVTLLSSSRRRPPLLRGRRAATSPPTARAATSPGSRPRTSTRPSCRPRSTRSRPTTRRTSRSPPPASATPTRRRSTRQQRHGGPGDDRRGHQYTIHRDDPGGQRTVRLADHHRSARYPPGSRPRGRSKARSIGGRRVGSRPSGFTVAEEAGNPVLKFPGPYANPPGSKAPPR